MAIRYTLSLRRASGRDRASRRPGRDRPAGFSARNLYKFGHPRVIARDVVPTSEVRAALGKITRRFDEGDTEPVFFGSHRRTQAVLVPIATWEKLLAHTEDELDLELAQRRLADQSPIVG